MSRHYFITGYPRSRTAWLAAFMTTGQSLCLHEGIARTGGIEPLGRAMEACAKHCGAVGDSDPTLPLYAEEFLEAFPDAPVLVVKRPALEVRSSLMRQGMTLSETESMLERLSAGLETIISKAQVCWPVDYHSIDSTLEPIWEFLVGDGFDALRAAEMVRFRIEVPVSAMRSVLYPSVARKIAIGE